MNYSPIIADGTGWIESPSQGISFLFNKTKQKQKLLFRLFGIWWVQWSLPACCNRLWMNWLWIVVNKMRSGDVPVISGASPLWAFFLVFVIVYVVHSWTCWFALMCQLALRRCQLLESTRPGFVLSGGIHDANGIRNGSCQCLPSRWWMLIGSTLLPDSFNLELG